MLTPKPRGAFAHLKSYQQGHAAFEAGLGRSDNPYLHTLEGEWAEGEFYPRVWHGKGKHPTSGVPQGKVLDSFAWTLGFNQAKEDHGSTDW